MAKRIIHIFLLLFLSLNIFAQTPIQKFWALNQCELTLSKLYTKPSAVYSLRRLCCNAVKAVNVRCDAGNYTQDIGFTSTGDLDVNSLTNFISSHKITGTGSINSNTSSSFSVPISPSSLSTSTITAIGGTMNSGSNSFSFSQSTITDGQSIIVGYYDGSTYTYMIYVTFIFNANSITVSLSSPERISGNYTGNLTYGYSNGASYTSNASRTRIYSLSLTVVTANGYVTTWYDQTGKGNNLTQTTQANQPQIVFNGGVNTENGKPTIRFMNVYDEMYENNTINIQTFSAIRKAYIGGNSDSMQYLVSVPQNYDFAIRSASGVHPSNANWYYGDDNSNDFSYNTGSLYVNNVLTKTYPQVLHSVCANSSTVNNSTTFSLSTTFTNGSNPRGMYGGDPVSELIVFPGILSASDRTRLYNDQKDYYLPSLLLNQYTNTLYANATSSQIATSVTAAYSIRHINSFYTGPLLQVSNGSGSTLDIGYTSGGDLDTASIKNFIGSGSGYVSIWYDQSGNGKDAINTTTSTQPQIVNNGVIYRQNGNPSLYFASDYLTYSSNTSLGNVNHSLNCVGNSGSSGYGNFVALSATSAANQNSVLGTGNNYDNSSGAIWIGGYEQNGTYVFGSVINALAVRTKTYSTSTYPSTYGYVNNGTTYSVNASFSNLIGNIEIGDQDINHSDPLTGYISEITVFSNTVLSTTGRDAIEGNQKTYYGTP